MSFPPLTGFGKFGLNALGVRLVLAIGECRFGTFGANFGNIPFKMWCKFKNYLTILCPFNQLIQFNDRCSYNSIPPDQQQNIKQEPAGSSSGSTNIKPLFSCGVVWTGGESESHGRLALYISFIYMFGFVLPLLVISTSYLKIIKTIRKDLRVKELKLTTSLQIESKAVRVNKV